MKNRLLLTFLLIGTFALAQDFPQKFNGIDGWTIEGDKQFYSRDNLYDYINGASDFYLGYDFQDLWVVDYNNEVGQMLTLELYRHGSPLKAFGIYSEERPQNVQLLQIGGQGFNEGGTIFFLADDYYVKVYNGRPIVPDSEFIAFAQTVARLICQNCSLPQAFKLFPAEGKHELSERFMPENFMGISGFNGVCTVKYEAGGESFRLFIFQGNDATCQAVMRKYFERLKYKKKLKENTYDFDDPYLGKVKLAYKEGVIAGILDSKEPDIHSSLLDKLMQ